MSLHPSWRRLLLAAGLAATALSAPAQAPASGERKVLTDPQARLNFVRALPYRGTRPVTTGFQAAQPVKGFEAPPGKHEHTQAYRSANGCVAFFFPLGPEVADVAFKWSGPACNGQPLEGRGELQVRRRMGETTSVAVLNGEFKRGMLGGQASKLYFYYDQQGQALPGVNVMVGLFANSVLHGSGTATWSGAADARPSAWFREGTFKDGALQADGLLARLRPYPGVEAEILNLLFDEDGDIYIDQARMNRGGLLEGTLYFENDPVPWELGLAVWRNAAIEAARLQRTDPEQHKMLLAACEKWRFEDRRLSCERGSVSHASLINSINATNGEFVLPLPVRGTEVPFRPGAQTPVSVAIGASEFGVRCDARLSLCSGRGVLPVALTGLYWHGDIEWRDGVMRPVQASLYAPREKDAKPNPDSDRRLARCDRFDDPLRCGEGKVFWSDGARFDGAWRYAGTVFEAEGKMAPRYIAKDAQHAQPLGWGRLHFPGGEWAQVRMDADGDIVDVRECDKPRETASFRCHLDAGTVFYRAEGRDSPVRESRTPARSPIVPSVGGGRFEPLPMPKRPVYVLPGMP